MKSRILIALTIIVIMCLSFSTAFAENGDTGAADPAVTEQPQKPQTPAPEQPLQTPPPVIIEPTVAPTPEDYGTIDLVIYAYNADGSPGAGYTVKIDDTTQKANEEGRVTFPNLTVERHNLSITNDDGITRKVLLYMSRSNSTQATGVAQDGTCGLDIARGVSQAYMTINFIPDEALSIKLSENKPTAPSVSPSATASASPSSTRAITAPDANSDEQYQTKEIYATFNNKDGKGIAKLKIDIKTDSDEDFSKATNSSGRIELEDFAYGLSSWSFVDEDYQGFDLEIKKGVQTGIISDESENFVISASPRTQRIYITFTQSKDGFKLEEVSESSGGMPMMFLIMVIAIIAIGVIVTVVLVKKYAGKKQKPFPPGDNGYYNENTPRTTGGSNKLNDNSSAYKSNDKKFDDRYRM